MHPLIARLGLGAAQFGLDGAVMRHRRPPETEVQEILALAQKEGVGVLDATAASPHAEARIGALAPRPMALDLIVTAPHGDKGPVAVESAIRASLSRLGVSRAAAVMVTRPSDLAGENGGYLWSQLKSLRDEGLFGKVGISAFASDDPLGLARRFEPDIIQAPASLLDQRLLLDGTLASVRDLGIEVHLRSIFYSGLLFLPPERAPSAIGAAALARLVRARRLIAEGRSDPLQAALGFALSRPEADAVMVGVETAAELAAVIRAASNPPPDLDWDDPAFLPEAA